MIEEQLQKLIEAQQETNRLLGLLVEQEPVTTIKGETAAQIEVIDVQEVEEPKPSKSKPSKAKTKEKSEPEKTVQDIVDLCSSGEITRSMILSLLDEYRAKKLPDLDPKLVPEFYDRLVEMKNSQQDEAA